MSNVVVLFARKDSVYKSLPACDVWDAERNALSWPGGASIVAHPPCRAWGGLRHMANPRPGERELAIWAVAEIRKWGGVLEHPKRSQLWPELNLPLGREPDEYGGFTLAVDQFWWGHRAQKSTLLYICGCDLKDIPPIPLVMGCAQYVVGTSGRRKDGCRKVGREITKRERESTPPQFAEWLVELAKRCGGNNDQ